MAVSVMTKANFIKVVGLGDEDFSAAEASRDFDAAHAPAYGIAAGAIGAYGHSIRETSPLSLGFVGHRLG